VHGVHGVEMDNVCVCVQFSSDLLEPTPSGMKYNFYLNSASKENMPVIPFRRYLQTAARIGTAWRAGGADANLRKNAWLYMLLADLLAGAVHELRSAPQSSERDTELVMSISAFIDGNLTEENLPELVCRNFGLSEKGVYLLLKEMVGLTLKEMIDASRVERACTLLSDRSLTLPMVSDLCGYSGEATFYRRFKSALGITPGEYRKGASANAASNEIQDYLSSEDESGVDALLDYWSRLEE